MADFFTLPNGDRIQIPESFTPDQRRRLIESAMGGQTRTAEAPAEAPPDYVPIPGAIVPDLTIGTPDPETGASQAVSGGNEALAAFLGAPIDLTTGLINNVLTPPGGYAVPREERTGYFGIPLIDRPIMGSERIAQFLADTGAIEPSVPGYELERQFGGAYTGGLLSLLGGGAAGLRAGGGQALARSTVPGAARVSRPQTVGEVLAEGAAYPVSTLPRTAGAVAAEVPISIASVAAERAASEIDPVLGPLAGMAVGLGPGVGVAAPQAAARGLLGEENSAQRLATVEALGGRPSVGLVGNPSAQRAENVSASVPFVGGRARRVQQSQEQSLQDAVVDLANTRVIGDQDYAAAERLGLDPSDPRARTGTDPFTSVNFGNRIAEVAEQNYERIRAGIDLEERVIMNAVGSDTIIPVDNVERAILGVVNQRAGAPRSFMEAQLADLNQYRVPIDVNLDRQLRQRLANLQTLQQQNPARSTNIQQQIDAVNSTIRANMGIRFEQLRDLRNGVGRRTREAGLGRRDASVVYRPMTRALERAADQAGVGQQFRGLQAEERRLYGGDGIQLDEGGELPLMRRLRNMSSGRAYNALVSGRGGSRANADNWETLDAMRRSSSDDDWADLSARMIFDLGVPNPGQQADNVFSWDRFLTRYNALSPESREMLFTRPDGIVEQDGLNTMNAAALDYASSMRRRARMGNPSGTSQSGATMVLAAQGIRRPVRTAFELGTGMVLIQAMTAEGLARTVASRSPFFQRHVLRNLPRAAGRTVGMMTQDEDEYGPLINMEDLQALIETPLFGP